MDAINERHGLAGGSFVTKRLALTLCPGFEFHFASGLFLDRCLLAVGDRRVFFLALGPARPGGVKQIPGARQLVI